MVAGRALKNRILIANPNDSGCGHTKTAQWGIQPKSEKPRYEGIGAYLRAVPPVERRPVSLGCRMRRPLAGFNKNQYRRRDDGAAAQSHLGAPEWPMLGSLKPYRTPEEVEQNYHEKADECPYQKGEVLFHLPP